MSFQTRVVLALSIAIALCASPALAGGITQVIAYSGAPLPSGVGTYQAFARRTPTGPSDLIFRPVINDAGQVAFGAQTTVVGGLPDGIFRADSSHVEQIADKNQKFPNGPTQSELDFYYAPISINAQGQVGFRAAIDAFPIPSRLALYDGSTIRVVSDSGGSPALNNSGQLASVAGGSVIVASTSGIVPIASVGTRPPGRPAHVAFGGFEPPAISAGGYVAFAGHEGGGVPTGIYRGDGSSLIAIALVGQTSPGDGAVFQTFHAPSINDAGEVAFGSSPNRSFNDGIYTSNGTVLRRVARSGDAWPDGVGTLAVLGDPAINNLGETAFTVSTGANSPGGVLLADAAGLHQVVRRGQLVPGGGATFSTFETDVALNNAGQVLFEGTASGTGLAGLFLGNRNGAIIEVARAGQPLLGSTISELAFSPSVRREGSGLRGLNAAGQVAYYFRLADGRDGVALWSVPEPSAVVLVICLAIAAVRRMPRIHQG